MGEKPIYIENQYLGRDRGWVSVRLVLALFCFIAYYINIERESESQLFLLVGSAIIFVSIVMMYMLQYRITVEQGSVKLSGLWTTRLVKIDLNSIVKIERKPYSKFFINNPVYNLHQKGRIKFYAGGKDAVWLTDRDGLVYIIGTQRQVELEQAILKAKNKSGKDAAQ
ncbi:hypothetical protein GCM10011386_09550 [Parapedobacter defluvii]|uniref:PH domain-containing protein n=1 Tax=Parapedobacter defluvii TaxID=2045106 RepID=A0ABQ1LB46_9SPHI|nr:hypothetical protein [Parapedobacter defluvii]RQP11992.1 MAG: hypothetical protein EAS52_20955 [Parapedobacter sp.]GGC19749.1 hypothetical protein GCM10011386_09550 [Parapedobacter defluvii]